MSTKTKEQLEKELAEALAEITKLQKQVETHLAAISAAEKDNKFLTEKVASLEAELESKNESLTIAIKGLGKQIRAGQAEPLIREKMQAGLTRDQAEAVLASQAAEDAAREASEEEDG